MVIAQPTSPTVAPPGDPQHMAQPQPPQFQQMPQYVKGV
jgi:hypothetical protein